MASNGTHGGNAWVEGGEGAMRGVCANCGSEDALNDDGLCDVCAQGLVATCPVCGNPIAACICKLDEPGGD